MERAFDHFTARASILAEKQLSFSSFYPESELIGNQLLRSKLLITLP